jgi:hypothetical protein
MRHSVIVLREEARRLIQEMGRAVLDSHLEDVEKAVLVGQMAAELEDVRKALVALGGETAIDTILTS